MTKILTTIIAGLLLTACITPEERLAQRQAYKDRIDNARKERCKELGFKPGTTKFAECRLKLETTRKVQNVYITDFGYDGYYHPRLRWHNRHHRHYH